MIFYLKNKLTTEAVAGHNADVNGEKPVKSGFEIKTLS